MNRSKNQSGAVSLFVVVFAALLMTIVTVSFIQLMLKDQQQATTSDLSQSAYDSALAGVEDAKRLLLLDQECRNGTAASTINCNAVTNSLTPAVGQTETSCDTLSKGGVVGETDNETIIQQSTADNADQLDQAYTCVKIGLDTADYKGKVAVNGSAVVPLRGVSDFDSIKLSWFTKKDVASDDDNPTIGYPSNNGNVTLPPVGERWAFNYPSLMRAQFMQTGTNFKMSDFDDGQAGNRSNANTLFLYPGEIGSNNLNFNTDVRRSPANAPHPVDCVASFTEGEYACSVTLTVPTPIDGNVTTRNAFLRLSALYNSASYKIELLKSGAPVQFDRVQPVVDSTGRANDVFRRVQARVELKNEFTYPTAEIDVEGDLCKNFTITDKDDDYDNTTTCNP